ncbi:GNAT family N-acetyltransferase [Streptomyces hirsutus]|uniref:GNAT family N-acetyltransferase n=1 Tax=Streptomyces hirsutus TaxID=35620 RepID=UPI003325EFC6
MRRRSATGPFHRRRPIHRERPSHEREDEARGRALAAASASAVRRDLTGVVRLSTTDSTGYLAYILREDTSGHGYATTAVRLLPADTRIPLVTAEHRAGNPASGRVLVKADFVRICVTADLVRYEIAP